MPSSGWTTLLQRPKVDPAMLRDGLKVIERNARAQTQLLGDLLDANQLMSGKLSLSFEPMDLNDAVRATLDSMRVTIAARQIRVESHLHDGPLVVMGDSGRLQQIVSNLLSNALKFTPADGTVSIGTRVEPEFVCCEIGDNGEGISSEFLPHIFEKFSQADGGSTRRFAGLGLGLAITKQLVESHGGNITVESEGRGKGATLHRAHSAAARRETGRPGNRPGSCGHRRASLRRTRRREAAGGTAHPRGRRRDGFARIPGAAAGRARRRDRERELRRRGASTNSRRTPAASTCW